MVVHGILLPQKPAFSITRFCSHARDGISGGFPYILAPDFYIRIEIKRGTHHNAQHHLSKDFELAGQAIVIAFFIRIRPFCCAMRLALIFK
jgi:hypothetical protein